MKTTRRGRMEIAADMIRVAQAKEGALKTHLVYLANLNFKIFKRHSKRLLDQDLLRHDPPRYYATEKGVMYLTKFDSLVRSL